ncbi:MAG TPA: hypothetical protein DHV48_10855 [Prolixibacteraceae bacterium]|nr:hypothetical protein [Prolixibacteraceae bacterium]
MGKLTTYFWYLFEYLKLGDIQSVLNAISYLLFKKSHRNDRILKTSTGLFFCRKQTNDFQFANFRYEWNVKQFIIGRISDYNVFIDGGACTGEYSIWLAQNGYHCFAFEPVSSNFEVLRKNIELNGLSGKITAFQIGLGKQKYIHTIDFDPVNTGASSLLIEKVDHEKQMVQVDAFDSMIPQMNLDSASKVLFKLDVEGMEADAISGAARLIEQIGDILFIIEVKHSGRQKVIDTLNSLACFEIGDVDRFNIYARKIGKLIK